MEYRTLGTTGVKVSPLCLGAMMFGAWGNPDHDDSAAIIHRALDAGINFVDTADVYSAGESEEIVGKALKGRRDEVVLATKAHGPMGEDVNARGNSRRWLVREVENSLRRLGTDWIDLYQIHRPDPATHIDETLAALSDLVHAGKVRYVGSSTFPAHEIVEAQWVAEKRVRERFVTEQPPYSLLVRGIEADVLPITQRYGMGTLTWSPLAGEWLSGKWRKGSDTPTSTRAERIPRRYDLSDPTNEAKLDAADALGRLAEENGISLVHVALAFVTEHPGVSSAIIGPRTMEQLESQLGAAELRLSTEVRRWCRPDGPRPQEGTQLRRRYRPPRVDRSAHRGGTVRADRRRGALPAGSRCVQVARPADTQPAPRRAGTCPARAPGGRPLCARTRGAHSAHGCRCRPDGLRYVAPRSGAGPDSTRRPLNCGARESVHR